MSGKQVLAELKKLGTAQNVKIYRRHGAKGFLFGVSFANLNRLAKKHKLDHELAQSLWNSKNVDARTLALMIADPDQVDAKTIDSWVKEIDYRALSGYFGTLVSRTKFADSRMNKWSKSKQEFVKEVAFSMLATRLKNGDAISKTECRNYVKYIEANIHKSPNWARYSMNLALIAIGTYVDGLDKDAIAAAKRIGKIDVDHGETSCKTPEAESYIRKSLAHRRKMGH